MILLRLHTAFLSLCGKKTILTAPADPLAVTKGVIKTLQDRAVQRSDMTAKGRLDAALNIITREALKPARQQGR